MKRKTYGRDAGLTLRMLVTGGLLGLLYVVFAVVLFNVLNVGLIPMLLIVIGIALFQYYTSDKLALAAAGAKVVSIVVDAISFVLIRTLSRYREYAADRGSALLTGAPENLMSALQKISSQMALIPQRDLREVQAMNAFFIVPASVKAATAELLM